MAARALSLTLVFMICSCATPSPSPGSAEEVPQSVPALESGTERRLHLASVILTAAPDTVDGGSRTAAAAELLTLNLPQSRAVLSDAMATGRPEVCSAVLTTMQQAPRIDPGLHQALLKMLPNTTPEEQNLLASIIARAGQQDPTMLPAVAAIARNPEASLSSRLTAIRAIAAFKHSPAKAAGELATVLAANPPAPVADETMTQLAELTGLPPHQNVSRWLAWWQANRNRPSERWLQDMVAALTRQVSSQNIQLAEAEADRDAMAARLLDSWRTFWPSLPIEQQQDLILPLLADDLAAVRMFAIERFAVLLRDGQATQVATDAVATLLVDDDPSVRHAVALLLPELNSPSLDTRLPEQFDVETDPAVLALLLPRMAAMNPSMVENDRLALLIETAGTRSAALAAASQILQDESRRDSDTTTNVLLATRNAFADDADDASAAAVLALVGEQSDIDELANMLSTAQPAWRTAVGQSMLHRGIDAPLLARAEDPVLYPLALEAVSRGPGLDALQRTLALKPLPQHVQRWQTQVLKNAAEVEQDEFLAVDDLLSTHDVFTAAQRASVLGAAFGQSDLPEADRLAIARRLAPLVLESGDPRAVVALLEQLPADSLDAELDGLRFDAAIRGRMWDEAQLMRPEATDWVAVYERLTDPQPEAAELVKAEIVRRFPQMLTDELRSRLGLVADPMMGDEPISPPPA